jgi:glycosyltransferase involved in cell wall biosynthesis
MLATFGDVWVITRENNRAAVEAALPTTSERDALHFVYVDLPPWARFWKRGQRGIRAYYVLWQLAALARARRLVDEISADLVWHLTLANAWIGSTAPLVGLPFVYGPVGGGVGTPWRMLDGAPASAVAYEATRTAARAFGRFVNPVSRLAWSRATVILVQNRDTKGWLPRRHRDKVVVFPNVVLDDDVLSPSSEARSQPTQTALFAGRLLFWKRADLAIEAVARADGWHLLVCGRGPDEERLQRVAEKLGATSRISFLGWTPRQHLLELMRARADLLLFPSMHDEAGWVVAEALANGLPVVCGDRGGPPAIAGAAGVVVDMTTAAGTAAQLARALAEGRFPSSDTARRHAEEFTFDAQTERLRSVIRRAGLVV